MFKIIVELFLLVIISAAITPFIRRLAFVLGAVDNPNARRVNKKPMPTIGGLGIFVTFNIGAFVLLREQFPTAQYNLQDHLHGHQLQKYNVLQLTFSP